MPFSSVGPWNRLCEKIRMLGGAVRCLMLFLVSSQFAFHSVLIARFVVIGTLCLTELGGAGYAQTAESAEIRVQTNGTSTGGAHAAVKDALSRPITAGGFVDGAPVVFSDITHAAGLDKFHHKSGTPDKGTILETPGSGVALLDYDNDGWLDIYLLNGSTFPALKGKEAPPRAMLLHNNHDGTFTDVTEKAGVANERWGFGVAIGDFDNDGWPDIYVSNFGKNRLYHNNRDGTFTDVAEAAGVTLGGWSTGATWGDYDHDGYLDLFVPGYAKFNPDNPPIAGKGGIPAGFCQFRGVQVMCGPRGLPGEGDHLFHNNGDGTFSDVSVKAGVADAKGYYGFSSVFVDVDDDGWVDLAVANDSVPKYLYRNEGDAAFADVSFRAGIATLTIPFLGWGTGFLDYDNDGLLDIFVANGHVYPGVDLQDWGTTWAQRPLLLRNLDGSKFQEVPAATGSGLAVVVTARGAAFGDLFNDGHIDVVLNNIDSTPTLLRNVVKNSNHWITLKLLGGPKSPRDAIGAKVFVTEGGARQRGDVFSGGSYGSSSDQRLHFGLGAATKMDRVEIHWPSGAKEEITIPTVDRIYTVKEGKGIVAP